MTLLGRIFGRKDTDAGGAAAAEGGSIRRRDPDTALQDLFDEVTGLADRGEHTQALTRVAAALISDAGNPDLHLLRAVALAAAGRLREAQAEFVAADEGGIRAPYLDLQAGQCLLRAGDAERALAWFERCVAADPNAAEGHAGAASALQRSGREREAVACYGRALALRAYDVELIVEIGNCHLACGDFEAALTRFREAVALESGNAWAWAHVGVALDRLGRVDDALDAFARSVALDDRGTDNFVNLAVKLRDAGRVDEAIAIYERFLPERPSINGHVGYSTALLTAGRFAEGWRNYGFRWLTEPQLSLRPPFGRPAWDGQDLKGRTILLHVEQGVGDIVQFVRYARLVKALGATVFLVTARALSRLARGFDGVDRLLGPSERAPDFQFYVHLLSLPRIFGTSVGDIPNAVPYLHPDGEMVAQWAPRVRGDAPLRVGLVWAGNPAHAGDRQRSMALAQLAPLAGVPGIRWYGLQKGARKEEAALPPAGWTLDDLGSELGDFADTAAVISQIDLLICVDTSVAHIAGAMGRPVWMLVPTPADWRWLTEREDSPWYPTMRLFRQRERGDWAEVVGRVRSALVAVVQGEAVLPGRPALVTAVARVAPVAALPRQAPGHRAGMSAVAETRHGIFQYLPDEAEVGDALGWYGQWREGQLALLSGLVRPGATVLEVGAGVGAHAVPLSRWVGPAGHLLVAEGRPVVRRILRQNLAANRAVGVTVLREGLGAEASVDGLWLERLDWLKVTPAGLAPAVLAGAEATLWRLRPAVYATVVDTAELAVVAERVRGYGYRCWRHETALYAAENFNRRERDVFDGRTALALLALPEEAYAEVAPGACSEILSTGSC